MLLAKCNIEGLYIARLKIWIDFIFTMH